MRNALVIALCLLTSSTAMAQFKCFLIRSYSGVDLSGGATTTAQFPAAKTHGNYPRFAYLAIAVDLTDDNDGVSNIRMEFTASEASGGTFRAVPACSFASPVLTCKAPDYDWDPQTYGKSWWMSPVPWGYLFGKITITPTGHGAGDEADVSVYGCY